MNTLSDLQQQTKNDVDLFNFSGGGLRDTTRIAASSPEMWRDIFLWNKNNVVKMIERERNSKKTSEEKQAS